MLRQARQKGGVEVVQAGTEQLPFADASFERVMVVDALHHFADQPRAIGEMLRVLKPGGRLVIEEFDIHHIAVKAVALAEKLALMGSRFLAPEDIRAMILSQGVSARLDHDGNFIVWIIADKD